jgi:hypothetical protein
LQCQIIENLLPRRAQVYFGDCWQDGAGLDKTQSRTQFYLWQVARTRKDAIPLQKISQDFKRAIWDDISAEFG